MKIAIAHQEVSASASPDEQDVLDEVAAVSEALSELGHETLSLSLSMDLEAARRALRDAKPDLVFNLVESLGASDRLAVVAPLLFSELGAPVTGSSAEAMCALASKRSMKRWLTQCGVPVPASPPDFEGRYLIKPIWEHASVGIDDDSVVADAEAAFAALAARPPGTVFAEAFIDGREVNVSVVAGDRGPRVLPIAEMCFLDYPEDKPRLVTYAAKWDATSFEGKNTQRTFDLGKDAEVLKERVTDVALACWNAFRLTGYARVDMRIDREGAPFVIDVNANPCLSRDAGLAASAAAAGIEYVDLIDWIVRAALLR